MDLVNLRNYVCLTFTLRYLAQVPFTSGMYSYHVQKHTYLQELVYVVSIHSEQVWREHTHFFLILFMNGDGCLPPNGS